MREDLTQFIIDKIKKECVDVNIDYEWRKVICLDDIGHILDNELNSSASKLKHYEDLAEQGRLLELPCKVGDIVYSDSEYFGILSYEVNSVHICIGISFEAIASRDDEMLDAIDFDIEDIGKTVFLTREEAEAKLAEMEKNNEQRD